MNLHFAGQEAIPRSKDDVWAFITNPQNIASCLPDVLEYHVQDASVFDALVQVAVGPVRGKFKFTITLDPQPDRERMNLKIGGGGLGSVLDLLAQADVKGNAANTTLDWEGTAEMRGPVAAVGGRVLDAQAQRVIRTTFANIKLRLTQTAVQS